MNPEVVDQTQEDAVERHAIDAGSTEGWNDLQDVKKASGQSKEGQMEQAIKKLLGPGVKGMTLEDIMKLSDEEIETMIQGRKRKMENMQKLGKYVGKLVRSFGEKEGSDPVNILLDKLNKVLSTNPEKLKKELKNFDAKTRDEILAVFSAFIEVVSKEKIFAALVPMYALFITRLFTDKEYLALYKAGTKQRSKLEQDLVRFGKALGPNGPYVHSVFKVIFEKALEGRGKSGVAGQRNLQDIERRLVELIPSSTYTGDDVGNGQKLSLDAEVKAREDRNMGSFETQRVNKLSADVGKTLNTAIDGLFGSENRIVTAAGETIEKDGENGIKYSIIRFEHDEHGRWARVTTTLYRYLEELEARSTTGLERQRNAEQIARLKTVIAARNSLDFLRNAGSVTGGFMNMYERQFRYAVAEEKARTAGGRVDRATIDFESASIDEYHTSFSSEQKQRVAATAATRVRESVTFTLSNVYRNYLNMRDEPKTPYDQALSEGGDHTTNPREMYKQLESMLKNLAHQSSSVDSGKLDFTVTTLGGMQTLYDPTLGKELSTFSSHRKQTNGKSVYDFLNELVEEVKADDGFYEAGHQYRYLSHMGSPDSQKKFFDSVGDHLRYSMTSRNMDRIYSMDGNVFIARAASFIETVLKKRMGEKGWLNEDEGKFFNEVFLNKGEGGRTLVLQVQEFLADHYPELPDWQRRRIMQHAFTIVFAGRFRYQQIFSYANPTRGYQGQADDKQMFNNVFAPFQRGLRFAADWKHDLFLKGAYWQPMYNMPGINQKGVWDPFEMGKEGFAVFDAQKHESQGRLAWDMTQYFQGDLPEVFAPVNRLKVGGYDTLRGWRRMANMGVMDRKLYDRLIGGGQPQFKAVYVDHDDLDESGQPRKKHDGMTRIWKSVENVGVNEVNAFVDENIIALFGYKDGKLKNKEAVDHFVGHLYERYLSDEHEFGKHLPHNYLYGDINGGLRGNLDPVAIGARPFNANMYGAQLRRAESKADFITQFHARAQAIFKEAEQQESHKPAGDRKPAKVAEVALKRQLLKPMTYDAMMVMVAERSPIEFLYRLRNQDEQNGLRLSTQIKNKYFDDASDFNQRPGSFGQTLGAQAALDQKLARKLSGTITERQAAKDAIWDEVTDDLAFVQGELRGEIDEEILQKRQSWEAQTKGLNIYGENWNSIRSEVNGGRGYVMDDDTVVRIMIKKYQPQMAEQIRTHALSGQQAIAQLLASPEPNFKLLGLRVQRAVALRNDIVSEMGKEPDINNTGDASDPKKQTEHVLRKKYLLDDGSIRPDLSKEDKEKAKRYLANLEKRVNRARWMRRMWDEGFLGAIPFMADNSEVHKVFLNGDDTMVFRSTGECGVAEQYKLILDGRAPEGPMSNMLLMLKNVARKGNKPEDWGKLKSLGNGLKKIASDEVGDPEIFMPIVLGLTKMQLSGMANRQEVRNALGRWRMIFDKEGQSLFSRAWTNFEHYGMDAVTIRQFLMQVTKTGGLSPEQMEGFASFFKASWFSVAKELIPEYLTYILAFALVSYVTDAAKRATTKK